MQLDTQRLSHHEDTVLADLVEILSPFEEATGNSQTENTATTGSIIPSLFPGLKLMLGLVLFQLLSLLFGIHSLNMLSHQIVSFLSVTI